MNIDNVYFYYYYHCCRNWRREGVAGTRVPGRARTLLLLFLYTCLFIYLCVLNIIKYALNKTIESKVDSAASYAPLRPAFVSVTPSRRGSERVKWIACMCLFRCTVHICMDTDMCEGEGVLINLQLR